MTEPNIDVNEALKNLNKVELPDQASLKDQMPTDMQENIAKTKVPLPKDLPKGFGEPPTPKAKEVKERQQKRHDARKAGDKFEVKTERDWWHRTDNTAIEVECNGSGSGITTTKSKYWVQVYADGDEDCAYLIIPTKRLRKIKDKYVHKKKSVGDGKRAKTILIPNSEILLAKNLIQK